MKSSIQRLSANRRDRILGKSTKKSVIARDAPTDSKRDATNIADDLSWLNKASFSAVFLDTVVVIPLADRPINSIKTENVI